MGYETSFLGVLVSVLCLGLTGIAPGGVIVPGYLALFVNSPLRIAGTLAVALLTVFCFRLASRYWILFGTRRFAFMILTAALWTVLWIRFFPAVLPGSIEFRVIGWVVPGLIANNFERQGVVVTTAALITATAITYFGGHIFRAFL
jgi:gamma-polyglutamate biosynthesis protein CapC